MSLALFIVAALTISYAIYVVLSRLSKTANTVPNAHVLSSWTGLWILYRRWLLRENTTIWDAHKHLGPVIRLGPDEVSVNSIEGLETIYVRNFDKHDFYVGFEQYDQTNMFSEIERAPHLEKRKVLNNTYSKSYIMGSSEMRAILHDVMYGKMLGKLRQYAKAGTSVEVFSFFSSVAMDMISSWCFGQGSGSDFLNDCPERADWQGSAKKLDPYVFYWLHMYKVVEFFDNLHLPFIPYWTIAEGEKQPAVCLSLCQKCAGRPNSSRQAVVFSKLASSVTDTPSSLTFTDLKSLSLPEKRLAAETMDHLLAGSDTTATTLTYLFYNLSLRPKLQSLLRTQLSTLPAPAASSPELDPSFLRALDHLPLLDALINETLRVYPPVPGCQARIVPPSGVTLHGHFITPGTRISCSAFALHRNESVFPNAEKWDHERWLTCTEDQRKQMDKWFWGWGSGVRMCIGKGFATVEMKVALAVVYGGLGTEVVDDTGVEQGDGYAAGPKRGALDLRFRALEYLGQ
ncbi:Cytochrome P450-like protein 31 [Elsinoe fawcettii]|nr:Cytochrome P450-like protein 31 [Elsinoe fawcettii]